MPGYRITNMGLAVAKEHRMIVASLFGLDRL